MQRTEGIDASMYATQWLVTVFAYRFPLDFAVEAWDGYITHGIKAVFQAGLALMAYLEGHSPQHRTHRAAIFVVASLISVILLQID